MKVVQTGTLEQQSNDGEGINQSKTNTTANAYTKESLATALHEKADSIFGKGSILTYSYEFRWGF
ncbi:MAG: hypothetical protein WCJ11_05645 [Methylococcaceae bacterium]